MIPPYKGVPIIDLKGIGSNDLSHEDFEKLGKELVEKFKEFGFVGLKNHGLPLDFVTNVNDTFEKFFELPEETKKKYLRDLTTYHGYTDGKFDRIDWTVDTFDEKETFDITSFEEPFPNEVVETKESATQAHEVIRPFIKKLFSLLETGLEVKPGTLQNLHNPGSETQAQIRVLYYAKVPEGVRPGTSRCGEHRDNTVFTLQFQDKIGGFQIESKEECWHDVDGDPNIINMFCGLSAEILTGGLIKAPRHRVIVTENEAANKFPRRTIIVFTMMNYDSYLYNCLDPSSIKDGWKAREITDRFLAKVYSPNGKGIRNVTLKDL